MNGYSKLTNLGWELKQEDLCTFLNFKRLEVLNDFNCLIYSLPYLKSDQFVQVQGEFNPSKIEGVVAFIGAGTGILNVVRSSKMINKD